MNVGSETFVSSLMIGFKENIVYNAPVVVCQEKRQCIECVWERVRMAKGFFRDTKKYRSCVSCSMCTHSKCFIRYFLYVIILASEWAVSWNISRFLLHTHTHTQKYIMKKKRWQQYNNTIPTPTVQTRSQKHTTITIELYVNVCIYSLDCLINMHRIRKYNCLIIMVFLALDLTY